MKEKIYDDNANSFVPIFQAILNKRPNLKAKKIKENIVEAKKINKQDEISIEPELVINKTEKSNSLSNIIVPIIPPARSPIKQRSETSTDFPNDRPLRDLKRRKKIIRDLIS